MARADALPRWRPGELARRMQPDMARLTRERVGAAALANARDNQARLALGESIAKLRGVRIARAARAVVVAAGPSLHRAQSLSILAASNFDGAVIATDSAILRCLRHGIVPDLVVTVDPHDTSIVRWFGDPTLAKADLDGDDYFRRQDMDELFRDEMKTNDEVMTLLSRHGRGMRIALATSAGARVVERALECGMHIYWFNPMLDDPAAADSITRALMRENGLPAINCGGNVGTACWMIADAVLGAPQVALTGIDFSYYDGTPYLNTQYYRDAVEMVGEAQLDALYVRIFNPHTGSWFYTDPAYLWFRDCFLELARDAQCSTWNCTGGGILFDPPVRFAALADFLRETGG